MVRADSCRELDGSGVQAEFLDSVDCDMSSGTSRVGKLRSSQPLASNASFSSSSTSVSFSFPRSS